MSPQQGDQNQKSNAVNGRRNNRTRKYWKFGKINLRTLKDNAKAYKITKVIHKVQLYGVGLQEVGRLQYGEAFIQVDQTKYQLFWQGHQHKRETGVGISIKICSYIYVEDVEAISSRLMVVKYTTLISNLLLLMPRWKANLMH